jgi:hypothetical protein
MVLAVPGLTVSIDALPPMIITLTYTSAEAAVRPSLFVNHRALSSSRVAHSSGTSSITGDRGVASRGSQPPSPPIGVTLRHKVATGSLHRDTQPQTPKPEP